MAEVHLQFEMPPAPLFPSLIIDLLPNLKRSCSYTSVWQGPCALNHGRVCHPTLPPQSVGKPMHASSFNLGSNDVSHPNLIKRALPRCSPYGMEMQAAFLIFPDSRVRQLPRHANNSQLYRKLSEEPEHRQKPTPDPHNWSKVWFKFLLLNLYHSNIKNSPLNETIYRITLFFFLLQKFCFYSDVESYHLKMTLAILIWRHIYNIKRWDFFSLSLFQERPQLKIFSPH